MPSEAPELSVHLMPIYYLNVNQASLEGSKRSAAQMLVIRAVSDAPVATVCQELQPLKNRPKQGKSIKITANVALRQFHLCFTSRHLLLFLMPR